MNKKKTSVLSVVVMVVLWGGIIKACTFFRAYNAEMEAKNPKPAVIDAGQKVVVVAPGPSQEELEAEKKRASFFAKGVQSGVVYKLDFRKTAAEAQVKPVFMSLPMDAKRGFCAALFASGRFRSPTLVFAEVTDFRTERLIGRCSDELPFELED